MIAGQSLFSVQFEYATLNGLVVASIFEEFLIRAAVVVNLIPQLGFMRTIIMASIYFVALHIPGWRMMGALEANLTKPVGGALSIFFLGRIFGWVSRKGRSFLAGSIAHCLNNLAT